MAPLGLAAVPYKNAGTENEDDQVNLMMLLKELRAVRKEVKEFRKDIEVRGELDKTNARLDQEETSNPLAFKISYKTLITHLPK